MKPITSMKLAMLTIGTVFMLSMSISNAKADSLPEYNLKTAYLYNFALLTEWPPQSSEVPFNVCMFGQDNFGPAINALRGKTINNRVIQIRYISESKEASQCHLVFIGKASNARTDKLINELTGLAILTVTDDIGLSEDGVMIRLYPENQRFIFDINIGIVKQANLRLSAKLLRLARRVVSE
jgi:hypothetical protein